MNGDSGIRRLGGWKLIAALCLLGLVVRLIAIVSYDPSGVFTDDDRFWEEIVNVAEHSSFHAGGVYAHDMPLTAILLGLFVKATGSGVTGAKVLLTIISSLTIFFIARIAYIFHPSRLTLWISGIGAALYPFFVFYSILICSETIFLLLVAIFFFLVLKKSTGYCVLSGFVAGLCHLTRPTLLLFLPFVWIWQRVSARIGWRYIVLSAALFVVTISPWVVRNRVVFGEYIVGTVGSGHVLLEGNNPYNETGGIGGDDTRYMEGLPPGLGELEADKWQRDKAIENIKEDPGRFVVIAGKKFLRFWSLWPNAPEYGRPVFRWVSLLSFGPVLVLSLLSIPLFGKDRGRLTLIWSFFFYYTIIHMITIGSLRYRLPLEPLMLALASASLSRLLSGRREPGGFRAEGAGIVR